MHEHKMAEYWAQAEVCTANRVHVEHVVEIADVRIEVVMPMRGRDAPGLFERHSFDAFELAFQQRIGAGFDPAGDVLIRRPAIGRVVLEAAAVGRIVRRRDDNAVCQSHSTAAVISEDGVGDHRGRGVFVLVREHDLHPVGRQHFERTGQRRFRKRVGVDPQKQRAIDSLLSAVLANGLADGEHMPFVETVVECRTAMTRGAKRDPLRGYRRVGQVTEIGSDESGDIDQHGWWGGLSRKWTGFHFV